MSAAEPRFARLDGKVAVITGAASGIGRAVALLFARQGATVVVGDRDEHGGEETVRLIREQGGEAQFVRTDVQREDDVRALMQAAADEAGGVDVIVNVAGMLLSGPTTEFDAGDWDRVLAVNLKSCFLTAKHGVPHLRRRGGGAIVNTASGAALKGMAGMACYAASKGAVLAFTRALADEVAPDGIRVNCLCPGIVDTPFNDPATEFLGGRDKLDALVKDITMLGRQATPEEIAPSFLYLASESSSYMTNQVLVVDGGLT